MTSTARITTQIADSVASVTIDNPTQRNALTVSMCVELAELLPKLDADQDVSIITLTGAGDSFCAGARLNELASILMDPQPDGTLVDHLSVADHALTAVSKPTIALVDGACMGGGWQIASACDFVVASERSIFGITPAKIGIIYPRPGIDRLVQQVRPAAAKYILFTGETLTAARAAELGLIVEAVPDSEFEGRAAALVDLLRERSRFSTHYLKRLVDATAARSPGLDGEWSAAWSAMAANPDMAIGVDAFLNREQPRFTWVP